MGAYLNGIRKPVDTVETKMKILHTCLILTAGIILGIFAKWLDDVAIQDAIWWQRILGELDLGNRFSEFPVWLMLATGIAAYSYTPLRGALHVLLFCSGMTVSYHLHSIYFSGFNPFNYMMIWYGVTILSPLLAVLCWYAKGEGKLAFLLRTLIFASLMLNAFYCGFLYFSLGEIFNVLCLVGVVAILWKGMRITTYSLAIAFLLRFLLSLIVYI